MTNSTAQLIRPKRVPARAWVILGGIVIIAATIPLCTLSNQQNSNFTFLPDLTKSFSFGGQAKSDNTPRGLVMPKAQLIQVKLPGKNTSDQAMYVEALDQATRKLTAQIAKTPTDPGLQNQLGIIYLNLGDSRSAEQCFGTAVNLSRTEISHFQSDIQKLKDTGKIREAASTVLAASKSSVELSAAHSNLARVYDQKGDRNAVISELEQMNKDGMLFTGIAAGGGEGALKARNSDGISLDHSQQIAQAESLFRSSQLPQALAQFHAIAEKNPKIAFVQDRIGLISVMTGDVSSGIEAWEAAAKLNPSSAAIESNLGLAYHQMGMDSEAEKSFRRALALDPAMEEAALSLSDLLSKNGRLNDATAVMKMSAAASPRSARAHNNLGTFLSLSGKYSEAISAFHKAIRIDPAMASAHYGIGVALMKTHKYVPAIRELKQAIVLNPKLEEAQIKIEEAHRLAVSSHS